MSCNMLAMPSVSWHIHAPSTPFNLAWWGKEYQRRMEVGSDWTHTCKKEFLTQTREGDIVSQAMPSFVYSCYLDVATETG